MENTRELVMKMAELLDKKGALDIQILEVVMEENRKNLNSIVASYEGITKLILYPTEFEKTPKRSIKRYLYTNIQI